MNKFKIIDILAAIIAISGLIYQIYNYTQNSDRDEVGAWLVLIALVISILNQLAKKKNKEDAKS